MKARNQVIRSKNVIFEPESVSKSLALIPVKAQEETSLPKKLPAESSEEIITESDKGNNSAETPIRIL